ncbi:MAG: FGGY-family carbohydrate kinase [Kiritimatiellae bacterium]|nr:FGGY-family carbohydrate kinase [Kiritimatiellia bacterium]
MKLLAYDFGTGGIKASLFSVEGILLASAFEGYSTEYPETGWHEQRPEDWWRAVVQSTRALEGDKHDVVALGISGHSLGVVPIDAEGNLLRNRVPIWSDSRADAEAKEFFTNLGRSEEDWYLQTGCGFPAALYSVFKIMWFRKNEPDWFGRVDTILGTKDYINFRLTGVKATDNSYASGSGIYDLRGRKYDSSLIAASGLPVSFFPHIVPATHILGTLLPSVAAELGLPESVQVVAGGVDNSCMALGAGAFQEGRAYNSLGSSSWIAVSSADPIVDAKTRPYVFDHVVPGQYASALAIFSAGTSHVWFKNILGIDYRDMDSLAAEAGPLAHGLFFNPTLAGGSSLDVTPAMRGGFAGLDLRHTRGDMIRAVMEGVAFGLKAALDELRKKVTLAEPLTLVGGGAKAPLWRQIYADIYGMKVRRLTIGQQCAALGAAALAAVGAGIWNDFSPLDRLSGEASEITSPDAERKALYATAFTRYCNLSRSLGEWTKDGECATNVAKG